MGLTNVRVRGDRGFHPGERPPTPQRPLAQRLKMAVREKLQDFENSRINWKQHQRDIIDAEWAEVAPLVDEFGVLILESLPHCQDR